jgi:hypothetical protein
MVKLCLKGHTDEHSHKCEQSRAVPILPRRNYSELRSNDLAPFRKAIDAG